MIIFYLYNSLLIQDFFDIDTLLRLDNYFYFYLVILEYYLILQRLILKYILHILTFYEIFFLVLLKLIYSIALPSVFNK